MRRRALAVGLVLGMMAASTGAAAKDGAEPTPPQPTEEPSRAAGPRWYGWQTLIGDGADAGVFVLAAKTSGSGSAALLGLGLIGYLVPSPMIHGAHGQSGRAPLSLVMRVVFPVLGALGGMLAATCSPPPVQPGAVDGTSLDCTFAELEGAIVGFAVGMGLAAVTDATVLAWKQPHDDILAFTAAPIPHVTWLPNVGVARDAGHRAEPTLGISGSF